MISRILVPIDLSDGSRQAIRFASRLARDAGASLEVLHVIETPYLTGGDLELAPTVDLTAHAEREAQAFVERHVRPEGEPEGENVQLAVVVHLLTGSPGHEILRFLKERQDIDLVVMATHGRGGVSRLLVGSVTDKVVRAAPCPVLTLRNVPHTRNVEGGSATPARQN